MRGNPPSPSCDDSLRHIWKIGDYMTTTTRAAIYARVSTSDQTCENQHWSFGATARLAGGGQLNTSIPASAVRRIAVPPLTD